MPILPIIIALLIVVFGWLPAVHAQGFSDLDGHWSQDAVNEAASRGVVRGYADGTFRPDNPVTRAEFVAMLNGALGLHDEYRVRLAFADVSDSDWFAGEVAKASYVGYVTGVTDTSFAPHATITRQEAATMVARVLPQAGARSLAGLVAFPDLDQVAGWARTPLAVLINKGYMRGHPDGTLDPTGLLTRVEAVVLLSRVLEGENIIRDDVTIEKDGAGLEDAIVIGDSTVFQSFVFNNNVLEEHRGFGVVVRGRGAPKSSPVVGTTLLFESSRPPLGWDVVPGGLRGRGRYARLLVRAEGFAHRGFYRRFVGQDGGDRV